MELFWFAVLIVIWIVVLVCTVLYWRHKDKTLLHHVLKYKEKEKNKQELINARLLHLEKNINSLNPELEVGERVGLLSYNKEKWEFPREKLDLGEQLGSGQFGVVFRGKAHGLMAADTTTTVAVKMAKSTSGIEDLYSELKIMTNIGKHINVVSVLGACTENIGNGELLVLVDYCHYGNLQNYLEKRRGMFINQVSGQFDLFNFPGQASQVRSLNSTVCTQDLINWSYQIACGMHYLSTRKVVHRDLAARNVLLADNNVVKICDFGLARSIYKNSVYHMTRNGPVPTKWLALESLISSDYSTKSDVWSYGVTLWEIFSLARTPYPGIEGFQELVQTLKAGYRMAQPEYANQQIYNVMLDCWQANPHTRPSFAELADIMGAMLEDTVKSVYTTASGFHLRQSWIQAA